MQVCVTRSSSVTRHQLFENQKGHMWPLLFFILVSNFWSFLCKSEAKEKEIIYNTEASHKGLLAELVRDSDTSVG